MTHFIDRLIKLGEDPNVVATSFEYDDHGVAVAVLGHHKDGTVVRVPEPKQTSLTVIDRLRLDFAMNLLRFKWGVYRGDTMFRPLS